MLSWRNAINPPMKVITNSASTSTRCLIENAISAFKGKNLAQNVHMTADDLLPSTSSNWHHLVGLIEQLSQQSGTASLSGMTASETRATQRRAAPEATSTARR